MATLPPLALTFFKFALVGGTATVFDFGITWLLKDKAKVKALIANGIGFLIAAVVNYCLNRVFTFTSTDPNILGQFLRFMGVALAGLGINTFILYLFHARRGTAFYVSKGVATLVTIVWNFTLNMLFTFTG